MALFFHNKNRSKCARALLIVLLAMALASSVFIVTHAQHDCIGLGCHTCGHLSICELILEWIGLASIIIIATLVSRFGAVAREHKGVRSAAPLARRTPLFSDLVRLNL
jgi:hypothetical protein